MLVLNLPPFENKKYIAYERFHGNGPYGEIPIKKKPIRTLGFTSRLPCYIIKVFILRKTVREDTEAVFVCLEFQDLSKTVMLQLK